MTTDKRVYTLRMQEDNFSKIKHIADVSKRSIAMQIEFVLEKYIADYESQNGPINVEKE